MYAGLWKQAYEHDIANVLADPVCTCVYMYITWYS